MLKNKQGKIRSGWKLLFTMLVMVGLIVAISFVLQIPLIAYLSKTGDYVVETRYISERGNKIITYYSIVSMFIQEILIILVPIISWTKFSKKPIGAMGLKPIRQHKKEAITGLLFGFASISLVFVGIVVSGNATVISWKPHFSLGMIRWLILFIFVGFAEEILGRGYIMSVLRQTKSKVAVILISAVIFALMHSGNSGIGVLPYINLILVGALFAYMYIKSGNIWMSIGYHITWNFFQGFYGFPVSGNGTPSLIHMQYKENTIWNGGEFGPEGGLFVSLVIILGAVFIHYYYRKSEYEFLAESIEEETEFEFATAKEESRE